MEAGEVTCRKIPEKGQLGWLQEEEKGVVWSNVGRRDGAGTRARQCPQPSQELAPGLQRSPSQCCLLPDHDLFNCSYV